jgi:hypothetical protein
MVILRVFYMSAEEAKTGVKIGAGPWQPSSLLSMSAFFCLADFIICDSKASYSILEGLKK